MVPGLWQKFWNGTPDSMQWVAVSDWRIASDTVFYHEWSPDALLPEQFVLLAEAVWPILDPHQLVNRTASGQRAMFMGRSVLPPRKN